MERNTELKHGIRKVGGARTVRRGAVRYERGKQSNCDRAEASADGTATPGVVAILPFSSTESKGCLVG